MIPKKLSLHVFGTISLDGQIHLTGWPFRSTGWPIGHPVNMLGEALITEDEILTILSSLNHKLDVFRKDKLNVAFRSVSTDPKSCTDHAVDYITSYLISA